jgi:hypothetical protein
LSKGLLDCPVEELVCYFACATNNFQLVLCGFGDASVGPTRGCRAVGVAGWMWAMTVGALGFVGAAVPILTLVSIRAVSAMCTAGYSGAAGSVAVALAA